MSRTDGNRYFRVDVEISHEQENGKHKRYTEQYLTLQPGVTEAEAAIVKNWIASGDVRDYRIKGIQETKILEVIK